MPRTTDRCAADGRAANHPRQDPVRDDHARVFADFAETLAGLVAATRKHKRRSA